MTSHYLSFLGRRLKAPKGIHEILQELSPEYVISRYPMPEQEPPTRLYGEGKAGRVLSNGKKVFAWIEKQLK
jgi:HEPN domain-containing protein